VNWAVTRPEQVAICGVVDFSPFFFAFRTSKGEFVILLLTFCTTLALGVDKGIMTGVALSLIALLQRSSRPRVKVRAASYSLPESRPAAASVLTHLDGVLE
jgi:MFS superfamily sulfate permease-like transporter